MIKKLLVFAVAPFLLASCLKSPETKCTFLESTFVAPASEVNALQGWVSSNHSGATQHPSGFFYEIGSPGSGTTVASVCSTITVKYSAYLTNGTKVDENLTGYSTFLGQLILGWQKGIPLIKAGGSISLYLPPSLGYGANAVGSIPANSILVFNIQLVAVQ